MAAFKDTHRIRWSSQLILIVLLGLMILPWLGETVFYSKGEPREAILAVSALNYGDWLLPTYYGDELPFKPPFLGWCIAVFSWIFNGGEVTEYLSRLPSALAMILMCWGVMRWTGRWKGEKFGFICALVTATTFEVFRAGANCRLDMVLTAAMTVAMFMMFNLRELPNCRHKVWRWLGVIGLLTIATMTKGPVGALLPCFILGVYSLLRGDRFFPTLAKYLCVALAALVIPALWAVAAYQQGGQKFLDLMMEENFGRLFGNMSYESHENPWWYNFQSLAGGMVPWTLFMLLAAIDFKRYRREAFKPLGLLSFVSVIIVIVFFTIPASKRSVYLLPAYPFLAYWITCTLIKLSDSKVEKFYAWFIACTALFFCLALIMLQFIRIAELEIEPLSWLGCLLMIIPVWAAISWMAVRKMAEWFIPLITASIYMIYLALAQPMIMNPRSDLKALETIEEAAPHGPIYSIDATYPPVRYYTLNYYLGDRMRRAKDFATIDSMPDGTVVLFSDKINYPGGVPDYLDVTYLLPKSNDNRKPLLMGIKHTRE